MFKKMGRILKSHFSFDFAKGKSLIDKPLAISSKGNKCSSYGFNLSVLTSDKPENRHYVLG